MARGSANTQRRRFEWLSPAATAMAAMYILLQPFGVSPLTCVESWPAFGVVDRIATCLTTPTTSAGFLSGIVLAALLVAVGLWSLRG